MQWFCGPQQETARISKYDEHFVVSFWNLTARTKRYQLIATTYINFATQKQTSSNENFKRKSLSKKIVVIAVQKHNSKYLITIDATKTHIHSKN